MVLSARGLVCQQAGGYGLEEARMITPYLFPKSPNPGVNKAEKKPAGVSKLQIFNRPSLPLTAPLVCFLSFFVFQIV